MDAKFKYLTYWDEIEKNGEQFWAIGGFDNALFVIDHNKNKIERICDLPRSGQLIENRYCYLAEVQNAILTLPQNCYDLGVFDKRSGYMNHVMLPSQNGAIGYSTMKGFDYAGSAVLFSSKSFITPIVLDIDTHKMKELEQWKSLVNDYYMNGEPYFLGNVDRYEEGVLFGSYGSNMLLYYDLKRNKGIKIDQLPEKIKIYRAYRYQDDVWIIPLNENAMYKKRIGSMFDGLIKVTVSEEENGFVSLLQDDNIVVLIPIKGLYVYIYDKATGNIQKIQCDSLEVNNVYYLGQDPRFIKGRISKEYIYLYPCQNDTLVRIKLTTMQIEYIKLIIDPNQIGPERMACCYKGFSDRLFSENHISLNEYIGIIEKI